MPSPWSCRDRISGGRTTDTVEVISSSWSLKCSVKVFASTEMVSTFGAIATSTSTVPARRMLSAPSRPRPSTNARVRLVSSMSPPRPRSTYQNADGSEFGALSDSDWSPPSIGGRGEGGSAQASRFAVIADQLESRRQCLAVGQLLAGGGRTRRGARRIPPIAEGTASDRADKGREWTCHEIIPNGSARAGAEQRREHRADRGRLGALRGGIAGCGGEQRESDGEHRQLFHPNPPLVMNRGAAADRRPRSPLIRSGGEGRGAQILPEPRIVADQQHGWWRLGIEHLCLAAVHRRVAAGAGRIPPIADEAADDGADHRRDRAGHVVVADRAAGGRAQHGGDDRAGRRPLRRRIPRRRREQRQGYGRNR